MRKEEQLFESVFTVSNFWDGPRAGAASHRGKPHAFECEFDHTLGAWSDVFLLRPLSEAEFSLVMEEWHIWLRWEKAWAEGRVPLSSHPAMPEDAERSCELQSILGPVLSRTTPMPLRARAVFRRARPEGGELVVSWDIIEPSHHEATTSAGAA